MLTDPHTGELGTPGAGNIYWEKGRTMSGTEVWLAKRQYGANVVLWWTAEAGQEDGRHVHDPSQGSFRTYEENVI